MGQAMQHAQGAAPFGDLVRRYRRTVGLTQEELAERSGLSVRAISDIEREVKHRPRKDTVELLADGLGLVGAEREAFQSASRRVEALEPADVVPLLEEVGTAPVTNLPDEPTPFIGREREIEDIAGLLRDSHIRMVTLTGPGGIGKTRLALKVGATLLHHYPDGVLFVSLASLADPVLVPSAIAEVLAEREKAGQEPMETLTEHLKEKYFLLVLDNFEHLLDASSRVASLLDACRWLQIMVTSRIPLHLMREHEFAVPPLAVPALTQLPDLTTLAEYEAVALFIDRARAVKADFEVTAHNAQAVAEICHRLDGLPLAIELAAARIKLFPAQALLQRLPGRLTLLTGGERDRPARHQTLGAAIDWSYGLLSQGERLLFARLSAFAGGCTLEAAEAVCNAEGDLEIDVLDGVVSLVEQSLVQQVGQEEPRFRMLETIQEYARERVDEWGEGESLRYQHALYYLALAEEAGSEVGGPERLDQLEREHDNLQAAVHWAHQSGETDLGLQLAIALDRFWVARGHVAEGRIWFEKLLALGGSKAPALRATALRVVAQLARAHNDFRSAYELLEQSLGLARELGDRRAMADALRRIGWMAAYLGDYGRASDALQEGLALARSVGDKALISSTLGYLAWIRVSQSDAATALLLAEESLELARELRDPEAIINALGFTIEAVASRGDVTRARALLAESIALLRRPDVYLDAEGLDQIWRLGLMARGWGDYDAARELWEQVVALSLQARDRGSAARFRVWLALLEREQGRYERARELLGESMAVFQELGDPGGMAHALIGLGDVGRDLGDTEQTIAFSDRSLALFRELELRSHVGFSLHNLAVAAWQQGDYSRAERLLAEALALVPRAMGKAEVLISIGLLALDQREYARAKQVLTESLRLGRVGNMGWLTAASLEAIAEVAVEQGRVEQAAHLFGAADAVRGRIGTPIRPLHRDVYDRQVAAARGAMGEERFEQLWEQGRAMTVEEAVTFAETP